MTLCLSLGALKQGRGLCWAVSGRRFAPFVLERIQGVKYPFDLFDLREVLVVFERRGSKKGFGSLARALGSGALGVEGQVGFGAVRLRVGAALRG